MQEYVLPLAAVVAGLVLLVKGGDWLVDHAVHLARSYRVPKAVVGAVVLGFGTSTPELSVSLTAALEGVPSLTLGNVIGSNIANVGLILGLGATMMPLLIQRNLLRIDLPLGLLAGLLLIYPLGSDLVLSRLDGLVLLGLFAAYLALTVRTARRHATAEREVEADPPGRTPLRDLLWALGGLATIVIGAEFLVHGAQVTARLLGVSERIIGLSVVAVGTSLPELAALLAAVRRREADLAVGNIAGSNIFNLLFVLGTTAVVTPVEMQPVVLDHDLPRMLLFALLAFPLFSGARGLGRGHGVLLLILYGIHILGTVGPGLGR